jgi:hypothetical protein
MDYKKSLRFCEMKTCAFAQVSALSTLVRWLVGEVYCQKIKLDVSFNRLNFLNIVQPTVDFNLCVYYCF